MSDLAQEKAKFENIDILKLQQKKFAPQLSINEKNVANVNTKVSSRPK